MVTLPLTTASLLPPSQPPSSTRLVNAVVTGEFRYSWPSVTTRSDGKDKAPNAEVSVATPPVCVNTGTVMPAGATAVKVPPLTARLGTLTVPVPFTVKMPFRTVVGNRVTAAPPLSVTSTAVDAPLISRPAPPVGLLAAAKVRVPPLKPKVEPAAST
jgi:hypothetical protein